MYSDVVANLNKINFIDISPKLKYKIINRMHISFGPYIGYAVNLKKKSILIENPNYSPEDGFVYATLETDIYFDSVFSYTNFGVTHKITSFDYGFNIGIDYILTKKILVSSEYSLRLSNLYSIMVGESPYFSSDVIERDYSQKTSVF